MIPLSKCPRCAHRNHGPAWPAAPGGPAQHLQEAAVAVGLRLRDVECLVHVGPALPPVHGREEQARQQKRAAHGGREAVGLGPLHAAAALAGKGPPFREG